MTHSRIRAPQPCTPGSVPQAEPIRKRLAAARKTWRLSECSARCFLWVAIVLGALLLLALIDNLLGLPGWLRLGMGGGFVLGAVGGLAGWALRPAFWRINDEAAAVYWERKSGSKENLLINAVQLDGRMARAEHVGSTAMARDVVSQAVEHAVALRVDALWEKARLKKWGLAVVAALALVVLYAGFFSEYAANAIIRYARPLSGVPALSDVRVFVDPVGEVVVLAGEPLAVNGLACARRGARPQEAVMVVQVNGDLRRIPMTRSNGISKKWVEKAKQGAATSFRHVFPNVTDPFSFHIFSGDGRSLACEVKVRERPGITDPVLELTAPGYTGLKPTREPAGSGMIHALAGSQVKFSFAPSIPLASGRLHLPGREVEIRPARQQRWEAAFQIQQEGPYALALKSRDGVDAERVFEGQVLLRSDALPSVAFETRTQNIPALPGATIPLALQAQDDFGLAAMRLIIRKQGGESGGEQEGQAAGLRTLKTWPFPVPGLKGVSELYPLKLDPAVYSLGESYAVFAEVEDHCPSGVRRVRSAPLLIRILNREQMGIAADSPFASILDRIQRLIEMQSKARGKTGTVLAFLDEIVAKRLFGKRMLSIRQDQVDLKDEASTLVKEIKSGPDRKGSGKQPRVVEALEALIQGPMSEACANAERLMQARKDSVVEMLKTEEKIQSEILNRLTALLGSVALLDREKPEDGADLKDDQDAQRLRDPLKDAKEQVKEFIAAQRKVIESTEELEGKDPEDLSNEDLEQLGRLAKEEEDWAKYFREQFTDLSKVPDQDFSNSNLAKEFNEVFQEIQKAVEELQNKNVEMAVAGEKGAMEMAEKLETNLEKWLPDTKDTKKWVMEEPAGEFDVPLADLPEELEDIIGELIDDEEEMSDEVEDVSSSWMGSFDKGAGWDAADGNISSMSAKGVTGNQLPNEHEVGGRSGEGRSGKSHGQFVEETADGKGGRQTPSRNTQDPYEEGEVDDKSEDALGGATGGGKSAGGAEQGLRGTPPPETGQTRERLKETQTSLRQQAEKISTHLRAYHLPSNDMDEAVRRMKLIEDHLQTGRGFNLRQAHSSVIDGLKEAKKVVGYQARVYRERSRTLPKHVRTQILSGMQQKAPKGYEDLLEAYYKALVEKGEE